MVLVSREGWPINFELLIASTLAVVVVLQSGGAALAEDASALKAEGRSLLGARHI